MKYIKEEERTLDGKKVKIKTVSSPLSGVAESKGNIIVSENLKSYLGEEGYELVLYHERGHLEPINFLVTHLLEIILIPLIGYYFFKFYSIIISFLFTPIIPILTLGLLLIIILLILLENPLKTPLYWIREILADKYAIKKTLTGKYESTFQKIYDHPGYEGNKNFYYRNILHPPKKIRFYFIKKFELNNN